MQTAAGTKEEITEGVKAGVYYYLLKPYDDEILISLVTAALRNQEVGTALRQGLSNYEHMLHLMENCQLSFQALSDVQRLSPLLATFYPDPGRVVMGIMELLTNAVEHGNLDITFDEKSELLRNDSWTNEVEKRLVLSEYKDKRVRVSYMKTDSEIILNIEDEGNGFDWGKYFEISPDLFSQPNGRGLFMCKNQFFDALEFIGKGNEVRATTYLKNK